MSVSSDELSERRANEPAPLEYGLDRPLRLATAARAGFPDGSVKATTLMAEARRGRLVVEKIGGRYFTTLRAIEEMRKLCRVPHDPQGSGSEAAQAARPSTSSSTVDLRSARAAALIASERRRRPSLAI